MRIWPRGDAEIRRLCLIGLAGLIALALVSNLAFIMMKSAPRGVDELDVWSGTLIYITEGYGLWGLWTAQPRDFMNLPPLLPWLSWMALELCGPSFAAMAYVVTLFQALLLIALYGIGRRLSGEAAGLLAACAAAASPIVLPFARTFMTNVPAVAMVACALWALLWSERFSRTWSGIVVGLVLGLALLAERGTPPLALSAPLLYYAGLSLWTVRRRPRALARVLLQLALAAGVALAFSGAYLWQYLKTNSAHISELAVSDFFPLVDEYLDGLPEPLFYPLALFTHQLSYLWGALLLLALPPYLRRLDGERGLLLLAALWPMAVMSVFATKYFDFDLAALVGATVLLGVGLASIERPRLRRIALGTGWAVTLFMLWFLQPDLLPQPELPAPLRRWQEQFGNFGLRSQDNPVFQDAAQRRIARRLVAGRHYRVLINAPDDQRIKTLDCEIANFAWLHLGDVGQLLYATPALPAGGPLEIDIWEMGDVERAIFDPLAKRRSCPAVVREPLPLPERNASCRPLYVDVLDGTEVLWSLCRARGGR